jgi:hypothetical protein
MFFKLEQDAAKTRSAASRSARPSVAEKVKEGLESWVEAELEPAVQLDAA